MKKYTIKNKRGMRAVFSDYGATLLSLIVPRKGRKPLDIVLGLKRLEDYALGGQRPYHGATLGRVANRIKDGKFKLGGKTYHVGRGEGPNSLHGGIFGFDRRLWDCERIPQGLRFSRLSPDGEEGYPGNLKVEVEYRLTGKNALVFSAKAVTDKPTHVNLSNHAYFNLNGESAGKILGHRLQINADAWQPLHWGIPLGMLAPVAGTHRDFRRMRPIGRGYDNNFIVSRKFTPGRLKQAGILEALESGLRMEIWTDKPGLQIYTANKFAGYAPAKNGKPYPNHAGIALETQLFPDSPNHPEYPSTVLKPGQVYRTRTEFRLVSIPQM